MSAEKIDKIFKWIDFIRVMLYILVFGAVSVAVWCTKIQLNMVQQEEDFKQYKKDMKWTTHDLDNRIDMVSDRTIENAKDIEWLKRENRKP